LRQKFVILTVPHAACPTGILGYLPHHLCDFIAEKAARGLDERIEVPHTLIVGDMERLDCDLNRPHCRDTPFRHRIRTFIQKFKSSHQVWVLDIHSFPHAMTDYGTAEVAFLEDGETASRYTSDLADWLRTNEIFARVHVGAADGGADIETEARSLGVRSTLIEFNEDLSPARLEYILDIMKTWIDTDWPDFLFS